MSDTLEQALTSVISQLDLRYEVVVVDDGSNDKSLEILYRMQKKYSNLVVIPLVRDRRRKLGLTRNLSINAARGRYIILHIDTDDLWDPHIDSFVRIFHEIEKRLSIKEFMLCGDQIHVANKSLLVKNPFLNVYYGEDRCLWSQLMVAGKLFTIKHVAMRHRIPMQSYKLRLQKVISSQLSALTLTFATSPNPLKTFLQYMVTITGISHKKKSQCSWFVRMVQIILLPYTLVMGLLKRQPLINSPIHGFKERTVINLSELESMSLQSFGRFKLSKSERILYHM